MCLGLTMSAPCTKDKYSLVSGQPCLCNELIDPNAMVEAKFIHAMLEAGFCQGSLIVCLMALKNTILAYLYRAAQRLKRALHSLVAELRVATCPSVAISAPYSTYFIKKMVIRHFPLDQSAGVIAEHLYVDPRTVKCRLELFAAGKRIGAQEKKGSIHRTRLDRQAPFSPCWS